MDLIKTNRPYLLDKVDDNKHTIITRNNVNRYFFRVEDKYYSTRGRVLDNEQILSYEAEGYVQVDCEFDWATQTDNEDTVRIRSIDKRIILNHKIVVFVVTSVNLVDNGILANNVAGQAMFGNNFADAVAGGVQHNFTDGVQAVGNDFNDDIDDD